MEQCQTHPQRKPVAVCRRCQAPLCEECCAPGFDEAICFDCSIEETGNSLSRQEDSHGAEEATPAPPTRVFSPTTLGFLILCLLVVGVEIALILGGANPPTISDRKAPAAEKEKIAVAQSSADAILIKAQVDAYRKEHGANPPDLSTALRDLPPEISRHLQSRTLDYKPDTGKGFGLELSGPGGKKIRLSEQGAPLLEGGQP